MIDPDFYTLPYTDDGAYTDTAAGGLPPTEPPASVGFWDRLKGYAATVADLFSGGLYSKTHTDSGSAVEALPKLDVGAPDKSPLPAGGSDWLASLIRWLGSLGSWLKWLIVGFVALALVVIVSRFLAFIPQKE